ncbi:MAG: ankyrin repeat domain-containing protein [Nitrospirae bacterium]|nr:ankyrin repeat domain-containing protein [Nitrospirota bacterium]MBI3351281.1 ankyrin repeat domain-containing protein [Nitrospirota bacterium]
MKHLACFLTALFLFVSVSSAQTVPNTPLVWAIQNSEHEDVTKINSMLASGADVNEKNYQGMTPLMIALSMGQYEIAKLLIAHGADTNATTDDGTSVLHIAVGTSIIGIDTNKEIINSLLKRGAQVNSSRTGGGTPLMTASYSNDAEIVKILLNRGALVNVQDKDGATPLLNAVKGLSIAPAGRRNSNTVRLLLEHKAKVNVADKFDVTPLSAAGFLSDRNRGTLSLENDKKLSVEIAGLLLKLGANPNFKSPNRNGFTLLQYAENDKNIELVNLLKKAGAK